MGCEFPFAVGECQTFEQLQKFNSILESIGINDGKITEFIKDSAYEEVIKR